MLAQVLQIPLGAGSRLDSDQDSVERSTQNRTCQAPHVKFILRSAIAMVECERNKNIAKPTDRSEAAPAMLSKCRIRTSIGFAVDM